MARRDRTRLGICRHRRPGDGRAYDSGRPTKRPADLIYGRQADVSASIHAAQGTMIALLHAEATGQGQLVDVSAQEAVSISQETAMQFWDFHKKNRTRTGELGALPIRLPGSGTLKTKDGYVLLLIIAPAGKDLPDLVAWMREEGKAGKLDEEPYASLLAKFNMAFLTQLMGNPAEAVTVLQHLGAMNQEIANFFASEDREGSVRRRAKPAVACRNRFDAERPGRKTRSCGPATGT
ncbi:CoA transferase [Candidatus Amarobacter glycogenicus]|uniref:CoA transferase n=1 Tax=Candidatus Amarobacter glycogenicus TaxID=3140699 RepID=UPI002A1609EF|nr:CoA transferase [Dehalococcoidia bacterium]